MSRLEFEFSLWSLCVFHKQGASLKSVLAQNSHSHWLFQVSQRPSKKEKLEETNLNAEAPKNLNGSDLKEEGENSAPVLQEIDTQTKTPSRPDEGELKPNEKVWLSSAYWKYESNGDANCHWAYDHAIAAWNCKISLFLTIITVFHVWNELSSFFSFLSLKSSLKLFFWMHALKVDIHYVPVWFWILCFNLNKFIKFAVPYCCARKRHCRISMMYTLKILQKFKIYYYFFDAPLCLGLLQWGLFYMYVLVFLLLRISWWSFFIPRKNIFPLCTGHLFWCSWGQICTKKGCLPWQVNYARTWSDMIKN